MHGEGNALSFPTNIYRCMVALQLKLWLGNRLPLHILFLLLFFFIFYFTPFFGQSDSTQQPQANVWSNTGEKEQARCAKKKKKQQTKN